jgi:hypothetical protein
MELDELKAAWRAVDSRIEAGHELNARIFRELKLERTRSALRPLWWLLGTELAIALGATVLLGGFLADHWHLARFAVPAIVLDVVAVLTIGSAAAQLRLLSSLDYAQPVAGATPGRGSRRDCGRAARRHRGSPHGGCHGTTR